jgi:malonyl-CoA/methylmalonyl-CoA synthetase
VPTLFPPLADPPAGEAMRVAGRGLSWEDLAATAAHVASRLAGAERVAVWVEPELETPVAVLGVLAAGAAAVPLDARAGERELSHAVSDSAPSFVLHRPGAELSPALAGIAPLAVDLAAKGSPPPVPPEADGESPALVVYTSGTTGPPKGVVLSRRAIATNLDALADVWEWTADDVLVHGLPLFHVHGLVLGTLGPARLGCRLAHVGRFSAEAVAAELAADGTMLFGVPTMYQRLVRAASVDAAVASGLRAARLLVSGSAPLPARTHGEVEALTGQRIVERYGMTETLMNCAVHASGDRRPGTVGPPLPGVDLRLVDDDGSLIGEAETMGEIEVRGPNLFSGYLNRPDATTAAMHGDRFRTGDLATRDPDGYVRIVGRRSTDLIKTGGYRVGAGEVEAALLEHPGVAEAAVLGEPDDDLGERIVAWVVPAEAAGPRPEELEAHVARLLSGHKRPRRVHVVGELPRNAMGKVLKSELRGR